MSSSSELLNQPRKCYWCKTDCGGTCLGLTRTTQMKPDDPAYFLLTDKHHTTPTTFKPGCYICEDPEFSRMGLPLCFPCEQCGAHVGADDGPVCDQCGHDHSERQEAAS